MADLSQYSDEELLAIARGQAPTQKQDLSGYSDEALAAIAEGKPPPDTEQVQLQAWAARHPYATKAAKVLQGVPFVGQYSDEALGWVGENLMGNPNATRQARALQEAPEARGVETGLNILGGAAGTAATLPLLPLRALGAAMPASVAGRAAVLAPVGAVTGGVEGTISGYGSGTTPETRAENAKSGGLIGAGVGAAAGLVSPVIGEGAKRVANAAMDWWNVGRKAANVGVSPESLKVLEQGLKGDDLSGQGLQRIQRAGPDAMVADAGPTAASILDTAIQKSGPGGRLARENIEQRSARAMQTVNNAADTALGQPKGLKSAERGVREGTSAARSSAYDAAYSSPIDYASQGGMALEALAKTRVPGSAIRQANAMMRAEGLRSKQILAKIAQDGTVTYERLPDVRQWDYITRAMNDVADKANGQGKLGGTTNLGRIYSNLTGEIRGLVGDLVPEYKIALATAADPIQQIKFMRLGERALSPSVTRDAFFEELRGTSPAERRAVALGIRSHLDDALANVTRAINDGNMEAREAIKALRDLSSRAAREKVARLIGAPEAQALFGKLDEATAALQLRASVADNSKTFARTAMDADIKRQIEGGPISAAARGKPVNMMQRAVQAVTGMTPEADLARERAIYADIAKLLTGQRGANAVNVANYVSGLMRRLPQNQARAGAIGDATSMGAGLGSYLLGTQALETR